MKEQIVYILIYAVCWVAYHLLNVLRIIPKFRREFEEVDRRVERALAKYHEEMERNA